MMKALNPAPVAVSLRGAFDVHSAEMLKRQLAPAEAAELAVIDVSGVTYAGTTLLNGLLSLRKRMRQHADEPEIRLVGASPHMRRVLTITRLDRVFDVV